MKIFICMERLLRKYVSFFIIVILGIAILYMLGRFITPILGAIVIAPLLYPSYKWIRSKVNGDVIAALIVLVGLFLIIVIPLSTIAAVLFEQIEGFKIDEENVGNIESFFANKLGVEINFFELVVRGQEWIQSTAKESLPAFFSYTSNFLLEIFIVFFVLFYLLVSKDFFINECYRISPFSKKNTKELLNNSSQVIKAVLIGQVLTAIIQGALGMFSFIIVGISGFFFWGIIMTILSIIPVVGAFLIWLPAGIFLLISGNMWQGVFVLVWGVLVVSQVDNFIRPKLVNKFANIHPLETFLGVFMGLSFFGFIGILIGPLIISLFTTLIRIFRKEFNY